MTTKSNLSTETASTSRREFLATSVAASTVFSFTIVPRHVLGGPGQTPPSERLGRSTDATAGEIGGPPNLGEIMRKTGFPG